MPELPEVETVRRDLARSVAGKTIDRVVMSNPGSVRAPSPAAFARSVKGRAIAGVGRRGKNLLIFLHPRQALVVHLKMTGVLLHQDENDSPPTAARIIFYFREGGRLVFADQRKFGTVRLVDDPHVLEDIKALGPEPLEPGFTWRAFKERINSRSAPVKVLLLDQSVVAGLGNIYASEALFRAGVRPQRPGSSLKDIEIKALHRSIVAVLKAAIRARGSSVDTYRDGKGEKGWFQVKHCVYDHQGKPCPVCGKTIVRETFRGRGTYWCPRCQR